MEEPFRATLTLAVQDLLKKIGFTAEVKTSEEALPEGRVGYMCDITLTDGQNLLIGQHGANIAALLHVVRLIIRKDQPENASISLDVNHYFREKKVYLEREALEAAREVESTSLPVTLRPMLPFERKLVHTLFATHPLITTESVGRGDERKILLKRRPENPDAEEAPPLF
ncbi:MAG: R3H domain-containing nucleic acid-binding protein [Candidatus Moraniibacteriota bacterium]